MGGRRITLSSRVSAGSGSSLDKTVRWRGARCGRHFALLRSTCFVAALSTPSACASSCSSTLAVAIGVAAAAGLAHAAQLSAGALEGTENARNALLIRWSREYPGAGTFL